MAEHEKAPATHVNDLDDHLLCNILQRVSTPFPPCPPVPFHPQIQTNSPHHNHDSPPDPATWRPSWPTWHPVICACVCTRWRSAVHASFSALHQDSTLFRFTDSALLSLAERFPRLTSLGLSAEPLTALPESLSRLSQLSALRLTRCYRLHALPLAAVRHLSSLSVLEIEDCHAMTDASIWPRDSADDIESFFVGDGGEEEEEEEEEQGTLEDGRGAWGLLPPLHTLKLSGLLHVSDLSFDDPIIGQSLSRTLQVLSIGFAPAIERLPESLGKLTGLTSLELTFCQGLRDLPDSLRQLARLEAFAIAHLSSLQHLPLLVSEWHVLTRLEVAHCRLIRTLPDGLGQLASLRELHISSCESLASLPRSVGSLRRLQALTVQDCRSLEKLPDTIQYLSALRVCEIGSLPRLLRLPEGVDQWHRLRKFKVAACASLDTLPEEIGGLANLEELHVGSCSALRSLPFPALATLPRLRVLRLQRCERLEVEGDELADAIRGGGFPVLREIQVWECPSLGSEPEGLQLREGLRVNWREAEDVTKGQGF